MSLNEIQKQINSISKTAQITNAMRLVSTTKYNRIVNESKKYELYSQKVRQMVATVFNTNSNITASDASSGDHENQDEISAHDMLVEKTIKKVGFLVITSDMGLAGNYNSSLIKELKQTLDQYNKKDVEILAIGRPIIKFCKENGYDIAYEQTHLSDYPSFTEVQNIIRKSVDLYKNNVYDQLFICYNHAVNALTVEPLKEQLLPLVNLDFTDEELEEETEDAYQSDFQFEPSVSEILDVLLPLYTQTQIYGAIIDAKTAEQSSRMQAMGQATDNANELIEGLQQEYHHERQKRITNEIIEITNGANAQQ